MTNGRNGLVQMSKDFYAIFRAPVNSLILSKLSVLRRVRSRHLFTFKGRSFIRPKRKMQLTYVAVVVLASMIFVLSGMVGYVYWQQTRMLQNLQSLAVVISTHFIRPPHPQPELEPEHVAEPEQESELPPLVPVDAKLETVKEDDRVSVNELDVVEGPPAPVVAPAAVDYESKTAAQLRELLTSNGIPFGKRDSKPVLVKLLQATA